MRSMAESPGAPRRRHDGAGGDGRRLGRLPAGSVPASAWPHVGPVGTSIWPIHAADEYRPSAWPRPPSPTAVGGPPRLGHPGATAEPANRARQRAADGPARASRRDPGRRRPRRQQRRQRAVRRAGPRTPRRSRTAPGPRPGAGGGATAAGRWARPSSSRRAMTRSMPERVGARRRRRRRSPPGGTGRRGPDAPAVAPVVDGDHAVAARPAPRTTVNQLRSAVAVSRAAAEHGPAAPGGPAHLADERSCPAGQHGPVAAGAADGGGSALDRRRSRP